MSIIKDERVKSKPLKVPGSKYDGDSDYYEIAVDGEELKSSDEVAEEVSRNTMPPKQKMQIKVFNL